MNQRGLLPRLLLIGDRFTDPKVASRIVEAVRCGVRWVQLRDHDADTETFLHAAESLVDSLRSVRPDLIISINSRIAVAEKLQCAVHLRFSGPTVDSARTLIPDGLPVGTSIHMFSEIEHLTSDYLIWSPVFETKSKPGLQGTGLDALLQACELASPIPVYAMGGIVPDAVEECLTSNVYGVAVLSGILAAEDIHAVVNQYFDALQPEAVANG
ncbi:MAG: thiamine phosphate synthase [Rhodothermia bacterium]|nr:MAG: thiamine phosphate synthase [Rhodothermia bacterium]